MWILQLYSKDETDAKLMTSKCKANMQSLAVATYADTSANMKLINWTDEEKHGKPNAAFMHTDHSNNNISDDN